MRRTDRRLAIVGAVAAAGWLAGAIAGSDVRYGPRAIFAAVVLLGAVRAVRAVVPADWRTPLGWWASILGTVLLLQHLADRVVRTKVVSIPWLIEVGRLGPRGEWDVNVFAVGRSWEWYLSGLNHFDGPEYLSIALNGYQRRQLVWFPLYPMLVRGLHAIVRDPILAGGLVSALGGAAASVLLWRWLDGRGVPEPRRRWCLLALLLYPYAFFLFGMIYSDAVFLALAIGAFVLLDRDRWALAGLVGGLAAATRPTGLAVAIGLVVAGLERAGALRVPKAATGAVAAYRIPVLVDLRRLTRRHAVLLLSFGGLAGYMAYTWVVWGSPFLFASVQDLYHTQGWWGLTKTPFFERWSTFDDPTYTLTITAQALVAAGVLWSVPRVGRRWGWGPAALVAVLAAIPLITSEDFMGIGRYLIAAFPAWALLGEWVGGLPPARRTAIFSVAGVAMLGMSIGFARGWYLT